MPDCPAIDVSASLMCARPLHLASELSKLEDAGVDSIHLDVMDGHFVHNLGFSIDLCCAVAQRSTLPVDLHLMVTNPGNYLEAFRDSGIRRFIFHVESVSSNDLADRVTAAGMSPGVAISPSTPLTAIQGLHVCTLLVMAVAPGFAGQAWIEGTERRVAAARASRGIHGVIGVDGNVTLRTAALARTHGASLFVAGTSSLFGEPGDYRTRVEALRKAVTD